MLIQLRFEIDGDALRREMEAAFTPCFGIGDDIAAMARPTPSPISIDARFLSALPNRTLLRYYTDRALESLRQPVREHMLDCGLRAIQLFGLYVYLLKPNGQIQGYRWMPCSKRGVRLVMATGNDIPLCRLVLRQDVLQAHAELSYKRVAWFYGKSAQSARPATRCMFDSMKTHLLRQVDWRWIHNRASMELGLDPEVVALAQALPGKLGQSNCISVDQYNLALIHKTLLADIRHQVPSMLRLVAAHLEMPGVSSSPQPLAALKQLLIKNNRIGAVHWRLAQALTPGDYAFLGEFYCGDLGMAMMDYLKVRHAIAGNAHIPRWLLARFYGAFGNPERLKLEYLDRMREDGVLENYAHIFRLHASGKVDLKTVEPSQFTAVLDWIIRPNAHALTRAQRKLGWDYLVSKAQALAREEQLDLQSKRPGWRVPCHSLQVGGYELVALRSPFDLWEEGQKMHHCVGGYVSRCRLGGHLVFSVRHAQERIATAYFTRDERGTWSLRTALGPRNLKLPEHLLLLLRSVQLQGASTSIKLKKGRSP